MNPHHYQGTSCKNGHDGMRYVSSGNCVTCATSRDKSPDALKRKCAAAMAWQKANPERRKINANAHTDRQRRSKFPPTRPVPPNCECCTRPFVNTPHLDHDHTTGKFRGWLCHLCNTGIGKLGDNKEGVQRALDYLNGNL